MTLWQALVEDEQLSILDRAFAATWAPSITSNALDDELATHTDFALLLIYLLKASLEGHLCATWLENGHLVPDPLIWLKPSKGDWVLIHQEMKARWRTALFSKDIRCPIAKSRQESAENSWPIIFEKGRLYLQKNLLLEDALFASFEELIDQSASWSICPISANDRAVDLIDKGELLVDQAKAISSLADNRQLSCIAGGPGTGKTHTAKYLVNTLLSLACSKQELRIALTAPTGRASANLQRGLLLPKALRQMGFAGTLHALLGITGLIENAHHHKRNPLPFDVIIVDESSMIDALIMQALLQAIKPGARLILMGDPHQLPPVEVGGIFTDLLAHLEHSTPSQVIRLKRCMRTEIQPILSLCEAVRLGDAKSAFAQIEQSDLINWHQMNSEADWQRARLEVNYRCLQSSLEKNSHAARKQLVRQKLLTPLKLGMWGSDALNREIYQTATRQQLNLQFAPLMVTSNHHDLLLYNGDQGVVHLKKGQIFDTDWRKRAETAHFSDLGDEQKERIFPTALLSDCELAWCSSIHKAQGSEYEEILLIIPPDAERMTRELLYTALTRTRARLRIWANSRDFQHAIERSSARQSGLLTRLREKE